MQLDGTLDSAAAAIELIPPGEMEKGGVVDTPPRGENGQFRKAEAEVIEPEKVDTEVQAKELDTGDQESDDDETYVELPPEEEGKEPVRYKLNDVLEGYRKAQTLEAEMSKLKESGPPPDVWDTQIVETIKTRQQLMNNIAQWARVNQPQPPDVSLLNPQNANYNPEEYFAQHQRHEALKAAHAQAQQQYEALASKQTDEQKALAEVYDQRQKAELAKVWPEYVKEKSVADKARADLKAVYGFDDDTLNSVTNHRFYALAKDALAFRAQKAAAQTAAKVVTAKPKLIPGKARSTVNGKTASFNASMGRLQKSGSVEDAASAIANLL